MASSDYFASTQWTMVLRAAREDPTGNRPGLAELFGRYQQPLYSVARARGCSPDDAADAVQDFFCELLDGEFLQSADQEKGRFRSFLLSAWRRFLVDRHRYGTAAKRGGKTQIHSLGQSQWEPAWLQIAGRQSEPDMIFQQQWAETLVSEAKRQLETSYHDRGREALFAALFPVATQPVEQAQISEMATQLNMTTTAVKVALHRLRIRFGQTIRSLVAETLDDAADIDAELDLLLGVYPTDSGPPKDPT